MQPSRQPAHTPHQVPNPPDPNSNRDTKLLETPLSCTKQTTAYRSNRDKIRVFSLGEIAPGDSDRCSGASLEVDIAPSLRQRHFLKHPVPAHPAAVLAGTQRSHHRARRTRTHGSARIEREYEVDCVRQRLLEDGSHTISRNDIKPHARTNDDSGCLRIRVAALRGKEHVDLASNIKIVCSAGKAGTNHRSTGRREWASTIRHNCHVRDRSRSRCRIAKA